MTIVDSKEAVKGFGIAGDFPGDKELLEELQSCGEALLSPSSSKPPLANLVTLLESLPHKGRLGMVKKYLAPSPHRDSILRDLFEYCFQKNEENDVVMAGSEDDSSTQDEELDEFVLICSPGTKTSTLDESTDTATAPLPLNLSKYHIFQMVIVLMAVSGPNGAELSRRYLNKSSSTKYRAKILIQCVHCFSRGEFSDQDLWEQYQISPRSVQNKIVKACKLAKKPRQRKAFLKRVYEHDISFQHSDLVYWLDSDYLESRLEKSFAEKNNMKMKYWGGNCCHGDMYLTFIRKKLEDCPGGMLEVGVMWSEILDCLDLTSANPRHLQELVKIWEDFEPLFVKTGTPLDSKKFLEALSAKGEEISDFDEVTLHPLGRNILDRLSNKEKLSLARKYIQANDLEKFQLLPEISRHKLPYKDVFAKVTASELWAKGKHLDPFFPYFANSPSLYTEAWSWKGEGSNPSVLV